MMMRTRLAEMRGVVRGLRWRRRRRRRWRRPRQAGWSEVSAACKE